MTTAVRERPILFSGPMVRAILDERKTQTRRLVIHQGLPLGDFAFYEVDGDEIFTESGKKKICPHGLPGDRLWVREPWRTLKSLDRLNATEIASKWASEEHASGLPIEFSDGERWHLWGEFPDDPPGRQRLGRFMPRWASRLTLEITDVRVQRIQEMTLVDCMEEGAPPTHEADQVWDSNETFRKLWDSLNAKRGFSWAANPWVWAISFRVVKP